MKFIFILLFVPVVCFCSEEYNVTSSDTLDNADLILVVSLKKGEMQNNILYLEAQIDNVLKGGNVGGLIKFRHIPGGFMESPNVLGGSYIVFLSLDGDSYKSTYGGYSIVEIGRIDKDRPDLSLVMEKLNLTRKFMVDIDDEVMVYPDICIFGSRPVCELALSTLRKALEIKSSN